MKKSINTKFGSAVLNGPSPDSKGLCEAEVVFTSGKINGMSFSGSVHLWIEPNFDSVKLNPKSTTKHVRIGIGDKSPVNTLVRPNGRKLTSRAACELEDVIKTQVWNAYRYASA